MSINPAAVADLIVRIANEEIVSRFGQLSEYDVDTKSGPNDLVTVADISAERRLRAGLLAISPTARFIGEEGVASDPASLDALKDADTAWIVDPLDGTRNFVRGFREYGTIVAFVSKGIIEHGWIYAAPHGKIVHASAGKGLSVPEQFADIFGRYEPKPGYRALGSLPNEQREFLLAKLQGDFATEPLHCSAYAYLNLLAKKRRFAIFARCHPWDHAAGALMIREQGGVVRYMDDETDYMPEPTDGRCLLVAANEDDWQEIRRHVWAE